MKHACNGAFGTCMHSAGIGSSTTSSRLLTGCMPVLRVLNVLSERLGQSASTLDRVCDVQLQSVLVASFVSFTPSRPALKRSLRLLITPAQASWPVCVLQVLSVQTALSIQSHPDKKLAEKLHAQQPKVWHTGVGPLHAAFGPEGAVGKVK